MFDQKRLTELEEYIARQAMHVNEEHLDSELLFTTKEDPYDHELDEFIQTHLKPSFAQVLFTFIDKREQKDAEVYKKAGIDRRLFSKIRSNPDYRIGKNNAVALALALELTKKETDELLTSAGYSLSDSETFDLVIQFCLEREIYNIHHVNQALDHYSLKPLGAASR